MKIEYDQKKTAFFTNVYKTVSYIPLKRNEDFENIEIYFKGKNTELEEGILKYKKNIEVMPYMKFKKFSNLTLESHVDRFFVNKTKILYETMNNAIEDLSPFGFTFQDEYYLCENPKVPIGLLLRNYDELMICIIAPLVDDEDKGDD